MARRTIADVPALCRRLVRACTLADPRLVHDWSAEVVDWADELTPEQRAHGIHWVGTGLNVRGGDEPFDTWVIAEVRDEPGAPLRGAISVRVEGQQAATQAYRSDDYQHRWTTLGAYTLGELSSARRAGAGVLPPQPTYPTHRWTDGVVDDPTPHVSA